MDSADSRQTGGKADRIADRKTVVKKEGQLDRQTLKYLPVLTARQPFMQASRQAGGLAGRKAGSKKQAGRLAGRQERSKAGRQAGGQEGRKECRMAEMQVDRQTDIQKDSCTNMHTEKQK